MKLVTRSQWGARAYRTPNGATPYSRPRRGVKLHYLGTPYTDRTHDRCDDYVRQLQAQHMDGNGWSDIGYSFLVCTHGYVYEGRGLKRRNSANGNTTLNEQDYAVCLLVGSSGLVKPTDDQLGGTRDAIEYCREEGPAGDWLGGHRDGYATACPGDAVYAWAQQGAPRPGGTAVEPKPAPATKPRVSVAHLRSAARQDPPAAQGHTTYKAEVLVVERALRAEGLLPADYVDGSFGSKTIGAYARWQRSPAGGGYTGADADGIPGKASLKLLAARRGFTVTD
ncbi:N-acetylmuramoyl-L-alanine amidase [Streptomyces galilaeus]|uniref:N-acetylmuramoyl-L-alanine amidase n=1 Tax=Streptomyces galilaeus TaxID=33899 RepID=A0ABW9IWC4_STRGJ